MGVCCAKEETDEAKPLAVVVEAETESYAALPAGFDAKACDANGQVDSVSTHAESLEAEETLADKEQKETIVTTAASDEDGLAVDFWDGSRLVHVVFTRTPWGLTFANQAPLTIESVAAGGHAKELGVQEGWEFRAVEGKTFSGKDFRTDQAIILNLSRSQLYLEFADGDTSKVVFLKRRPWGLIFNNEAPMTVQHVIEGGYADLRGIKTGWVFKSVNGKALTGKDYNSDKHILLEEAKRLREVPV
jgi:hypothetical protein